MTVRLTSNPNRQANSWQTAGWSFYGDPYKAHPSPIGEYRYGVGFFSQQTARIDWTIWENDVELEADESRKRIEELCWPWGIRAVVESVVANLLVAGELSYVAEVVDGRNEWSTVSIVDSNRREKISKAALSYDLIWSHPADPNRPDPPGRAVIDPLAELQLLSRLSRSQLANRLASLPILAVSTAFEGVDTKENQDLLLDRFITASKSKLVNADDPEQMIAMMLFANEETVQDGLKWISPPMDFVDRLDRLKRAAIDRVANGFPLPPEVLTGMTSTNRATAFQIEDAVYRAHIEPVAAMPAELFETILNTLAVDGKEYRVVADPTGLLARRHSVSDALDALDRGVASRQWVREVMAIPLEGAATDEDIEILLARTGRRTIDERSPDPSAERVAGDSSLSAAINLDTAALGIDLGNVDRELRAMLLGGFHQSAVHALEKLGSRLRQEVRNDKGRRTAISDLANKSVPNAILSDHEYAPDFDVDSHLFDTLEDSLDPWLGDVVRATTERVNAVIREAGISVDFSFSDGQRDALIGRLITDVVNSDYDAENPDIGRSTVDWFINAMGDGTA